ncbi:hypothetical protein M569_09111, partial [Genlisea aurea]
MEVKPFLLDIDELISQFIESESISFAEFKRIWLSERFSFIFESMPSTNLGFLMQSFYAHSLGYIFSSGPLSNRLGGLYCLYCLYETQPFKPPLRIYLSLGELRQLKNFVVDSKRSNLHVVKALVKRMLEKNAFLFGSVGVDEGSAAERVNELIDIQNAQVQMAYDKLFADSRLEHVINMDMGAELDIESLKKRSRDYAVAKQRAIKEASRVIDVGNVKHMIENGRLLIGDSVEKTAADWSRHKEAFYKQTGFRVPTNQPNVPTDSERNHASPEDDGNEDDEFGRELEES